MLDLTEIKARAVVATDGPTSDQHDYLQAMADRAFIAAARTDVLVLVAEVERLRAAITPERAGVNPDAFEKGYAEAIAHVLASLGDNCDLADGSREAAILNEFGLYVKGWANTGLTRTTPRRPRT